MDRQSFPDSRLWEIRTPPRDMNGRTGSRLALRVQDEEQHIAHTQKHAELMVERVTLTSPGRLGRRNVSFEKWKPSAHRRQRLHRRRTSDGARYVNNRAFGTAALACDHPSKGVEFTTTTVPRLWIGGQCAQRPGELYSKRPSAMSTHRISSRTTCGVASLGGGRSRQLQATSGCRTTWSEATRHSRGREATIRLSIASAERLLGMGTDTGAPTTISARSQMRVRKRRLIGMMAKGSWWQYSTTTNTSRYRGRRRCFNRSRAPARTTSERTRAAQSRPHSHTAPAPGERPRPGRGGAGGVDWRRWAGGGPPRRAAAPPPHPAAGDRGALPPAQPDGVLAVQMGPAGPIPPAAATRRAAAVPERTGLLESAPWSGSR